MLKMRGLPISLLCLALLIQVGSGQRVPLPVTPTEVAPGSTGTYIILAPNTIHPGLPLSISVSILDSQTDVTVTATISKAQESRRSTVVTQSQQFSPGATAVMSLQVPADESGTAYKLLMEGSGGLTFSKIKDLIFSPKSFSILVQTDKAIYKPGQTVHFRAMAIYPDLKPYLGSFDALLKDPLGNTIQQWKDLINVDYGVVSGETIMSDTPVLGDWTITVTANNQNYDHVITIDEYVLPKFEVIVSPPSHIISTDNEAVVMVEAKYTYGEPVKGSVSMEVKIYEDKIYNVEFEIDGKAQTVVKKEDLVMLSYSSLYPGQTFIVTATVTEALTGIQQTGTGETKYELKRIKVTEQPGNPTVYKPGLFYTAFVTVSHVDGSPLTSAERMKQVYVEHSHSMEPESIFSQMPIPDDGVVMLNFSYPRKATWASFKVSYYEESYYAYEVHKQLSPADSQSKQFLQIVPENTNFRAGNVASFLVRLTEAVPKLTYQVFSKGSIVRSETVTSTASVSKMLSFDVTPDMAPKARLVVFYVGSGEVYEIIMDSIDMNVEGTFTNEMDIGFNRAEVEPGDAIQLDITADTNSFVGILAIDTSVMLLKTGNDITQSQVVDSLGEFDTSKSSVPDFFGRPVFRRKRSVIWPFPSPGKTAKEVFNSAGILVFTDALVYGTIFPDYPRVADEEGGVIMEVATLPQMVSIRKDFPETWLWSDYVTGNDGRVTVETIVPDTITTWVASAFSMSAQNGIGVVENPAEVKVFRKFFVSLSLPYSVIRGEKFVLLASVFNYHSSPVQATVTLTDTEEFQVFNYDENGTEKFANGDQVQSVKVPANDGKTLYFAILPKKLGMIDLSVQAVTDLASDAVVRQLLVEPEGVPTSYSESVFVDFGASQDTLIKDFTFGLPKDVLVPGSVRSQLTFTGDIMGPTMSGLDQLLKLPSGCGEQTMLSFAPDVFIYKYLRETNQNNPSVMQKAKDFMIKGYQRELNYKHEDHSFSAFGNTDPSGSTWLTAFVAKSFSQASGYVYIEPNVVVNAVNWVIRQQTSDGDFREPGRVIHSDMQGGVSSSSTMTAYVLITLKEVQLQTYMTLPQEFLDRVDRSANLAKSFLEKRYASISQDVYALSLVTYALTLAGSTEANRFMAALEGVAIVEDGNKHWEMPNSGVEDVDAWFCAYNPSPSSNIEMTGYTLLTYMALDNMAEGASVARWLTGQRNGFGGYSSTQDTVIGLQALSAFATKLGVTPRNFNINVKASDAPDYNPSVTVTADNSIVLQKLELPVSSGTMQVEMTGTGSCLMQFSVFYNLEEVTKLPSFQLSVSIQDVDQNTVIITACGRYVGGSNATGMTMLEVGLPSGFYADEDALKVEVGFKTNLDKYEIGRRTVYLYLNMMIRDYSYCYTVIARRDKIVTNLKPNNAIIYEYYKPGYQAVTSYSSKSLSESSICDTCRHCCGLGPENGGGRATGAIWLVAMTTLLALFNN